MHIATSIYTFIFGVFVGKDEYGNSYYRSKNLKKKQKRWVIYNGIIEASKVPANWHRWLHYTSDILPSEKQSEKQAWEKPHQPNFTGTSQSYYPSRDSKKPLYQAWQPEK